MRYTPEHNPTIFGKILRGELPNRTVYEDEHVLAFHSIQPLAEIHVVIIPKYHLNSLQEVEETDAVMLGHLLLATRKVAEALGVNEQGFCIVCNAGKVAEQQVPHLHLNFLSKTDGTPLGLFKTHS